jgi:alkanesulfonate monooxygenase SsuD/methylene tetrahydromethanopterin reductase-like flavin-dependent oxidoreductase (luciferase family)
MGAPRIGAFPPLESLAVPADRERAVAAALASGVDHLGVGDHVSFFVGAGTDGLVTATTLLAMQSDLPVYVALYLLPLRHPVPVARQVATISELFPGRLILGVGIGGEDRHEVEVCGVDPSTRGRRMDDCMTVLRGLLSGESVTHHGDFFDLDEALIRPAADPPVPLIVGGRSDAGIRRAALHGDGWLGIWASPKRYGQVVEQIAEQAAEAGRGDVAWQHGLNVWCGLDASRDEARRHVAEGMQTFYGIGFESFERWTPFGTPEDVAGFLAPYLDAGCDEINLIPRGADPEAVMHDAGEVARLLRASRPG